MTGDDRVLALALQADGKIVAGGEFTEIAGSMVNSSPSSTHSSPTVSNSANHDEVNSSGKNKPAERRERPT